MIYILILLLLVYCVWYYDVHERSRYKGLFFWGIFAVFFLLSGLRYKIGIDTLMYMSSWGDYGDFWDFHWIDDITRFQNSSDKVERFRPGWILYCMFLKGIWDDIAIMHITTALIFNLGAFRVIKKYAEYPFLTLLIFYISFKFLEFEFEIMRESVAVGVYLLISFDAYMKKKWKIYYLGVLLAYFIHTSAILMFILPLLRNIDWSLKKYSLLWVLPSFIIGVAGHALLGNILNIFLGGEDFISQYVEDAMEEETNFNYFILFSIQPVLFYGLSALFYKQFRNKTLVPLVFFSLMFLNFNLIYFTSSRLVNYIIIPVFIGIAPLLMHLVKSWRTVWVAVLFMLAYFTPTLYSFTKPVNVARYHPYQWIIDPHETNLQKNR